MSTPANRYEVPALLRGLQVLEQFSRSEPLLTGAELAKRLGLPRASVFRILTTLEQAGYLERQADSAEYRLGVAVLRLGFEVLASMDLAEHARPIIEALRDATGYSSHVVVRDGREVVFIAKAAGHSTLFNSIKVGARLPAHATVLGRVLLSRLERRALVALYPERKLEVFTPSTPANLEKLVALIETVREQGYGISEGGFEAGISTIAAPVLDAAEGIVGAVSLTVPAANIPEHERLGLIEAVCDAAQAITRRMNPHGPKRPNQPAKAA
jgi:DNA-binding IclR family transcriptional regulator